MIIKTFVPNRFVSKINEAAIETFDCREGVLVDSYIAADEAGEVFIAFETPETAWCSGYTVLTGPEDELWDAWNKFTERYDEEEYENG